MTFLGECFLFTAFLSATAHLSTQTYDPWTLQVLPSSPCDSAYCYDATISRVGNIFSNVARASTRDAPGLYLIPATNLLLHVAQPERCFVACLLAGWVPLTACRHTWYTTPTQCTLQCVCVHTAKCAGCYARKTPSVQVADGSTKAHNHGLRLCPCASCTW